MLTCFRRKLLRVISACPSITLLVARPVVFNFGRLTDRGVPKSQSAAVSGRAIVQAKWFIAPRSALNVVPLFSFQPVAATTLTLYVFPLSNTAMSFFGSCGRMSSSLAGLSASFRVSKYY